MWVVRRAISRSTAFLSTATQKKRIFSTTVNIDISSGSIAFADICPGDHMKWLQMEDAENLRRVKKLQTSISTRRIDGLCRLGCDNLNIAINFIRAIDALEELSILNYEEDPSGGLWQAILHHAKSLKSLGIHSPPQTFHNVWNPRKVKQVNDKFVQLKKLEMDISLEDAEATLSSNTSVVAVLDELTKIRRLESALVNVNLPDTANKFASEHTYSAMGSISFPSANEEACTQLAKKIFERFSDSLKHLEVRFPRRKWDDRAQFSTLAYSVHVNKDEVKSSQDDFKFYLPDLLNRDPLLTKMIEEAELWKNITRASDQFRELMDGDSKYNVKF